MLVFIPNLLWPFISRVIFKHSISFVEVFAQVAVILVLVFSIKGVSEWAAIQDTEVWSGYVTGKEQNRVSCSHSYSCNCRQVCSGSGSSRTCSTVCDTCYEHPYDYDWDVYSSIGTFTISRVDRRGVKEPSRWTKVSKDDPVSDARLYDNYILAAPDSLFNFENSLIEKYGSKIPNYPSRVYDYYHVDRVINLGVPNVSAKQWSRDLQRRLSKISGRKKVNAVVVLTTQSSTEYADAIKAKWKGGKKNDVIMVVGVSPDHTINWVRILSWSKKELFKIQIEDDIRSIGQLDRGEMFDVMFKYIESGYSLMNMAEYEYLKNEMKPSVPALIIGFILCFLANLSLTWFMHRNDVLPQTPSEWIRTIRSKF